MMLPLSLWRQGWHHDDSRFSLGHHNSCNNWQYGNRGLQNWGFGIHRRCTVSVFNNINADIPDSNAGWSNVGPTSALSSRSWANISPTFIAVWDRWGYQTADIAKTGGGQGGVRGEGEG